MALGFPSTKGEECGVDTERTGDRDFGPEGCGEDGVRRRRRHIPCRRWARGKEAEARTGGRTAVLLRVVE
jgi:hypothetical protein